MAKPIPKYKFSFVMPVYNVEAYLAETVDSILHQRDIDFQRDCQIIFINDGSPDNVESICLHYKRKFPDNIVYIKQDNQGVSAARNRGISEIKGKYVSFLDSDDKLSANTLSEAYGFFEAHPDEVDVVAFKIQFFGAKNHGHILNTKFQKGDRVIDLEKEPFVQSTTATTIIKAAAIGRTRFDTRLKYGEDGKFINQLILKKLRLGVMSQPTYYYRSRRTGDSAVNKQTKDKSWYFDTLDRYLLQLTKDANKRYGRIPKYIQYCVAYELGWRINHFPRSILQGDDNQAYQQRIIKLLRQLDDEVILDQSHITPLNRLLAVGLSRQAKLSDIITAKHGNYYIEGRLAYDFSKTKPGLHLSFIKVKDDHVIIEGMVNLPLSHDAKIIFSDGRHTYTASRCRQYSRFKFLGQPIELGSGYKVKLPIRDGARLQAFLRLGSADVPLQLITGKYSRLNPQTNQSYRLDGDYLIRRRQYELSFTTKSGLARIVREAAYLLAILKRSVVLRQLKRPKKTLKQLVGHFAVVAIRILYFVLKAFKVNRIWLICDRPNTATDNGYYFFKYAVQNRPAHTRLVFVLNKTAKQYRELSGLGEVVQYGSLKYRLLFLLSDKIISSHFDNYIRNAFGAFEPYLRDLYNFSFVYLEHGVLAQDLSAHLNRFNRNIALLTAAAEREKTSVISDPSYGYDASVVKVTGHARFDGLISRPESKIVFMPSWRLNIASRQVKRGQRGYSEQFKQSDYYQFYNRLINDRRLLDCLKKHNMTGEFYVHPNHAAQWQDFQSNDVVKVLQPPNDYEPGLTSADVLVTDYSGVAFDFAYMKKPVIYTQFDFNTFYDNHSYDQGYFSFDKDGFGPVTYDYESSIQAIIKTINHGNNMDDKYQKRVESFFYRLDHNNSARIMTVIEGMKTNA